MRSQVIVSITRAELIAYARQYSEPADAIPDDAQIYVYSDGDYTAVSTQLDEPVQVRYEAQSEVPRVDA